MTFASTCSGPAALNPLFSPAGQQSLAARVADELLLPIPSALDEDAAAMTSGSDSKGAQQPPPPRDTPAAAQANIDWGDLSLHLGISGGGGLLGFAAGELIVSRFPIPRFLSPLVVGATTAAGSALGEVANGLFLEDHVDKGHVAAAATTGFLLGATADRMTSAFDTASLGSFLKQAGLLGGTSLNAGNAARTFVNTKGSLGDKVAAASDSATNLGTFLLGAGLGAATGGLARAAPAATQLVMSKLGLDHVLERMRFDRDVSKELGRTLKHPEVQKKVTEVENYLRERMQALGISPDALHSWVTDGDATLPLRSIAGRLLSNQRYFQHKDFKIVADLWIEALPLQSPIQRAHEIAQLAQSIAKDGGNRWTLIQSNGEKATFTEVEKFAEALHDDGVRFTYLYEGYKKEAEFKIGQMADEIVRQSPALQAWRYRGADGNTQLYTDPKELARVMYHDGWQVARDVVVIPKLPE